MGRGRVQDLYDISLLVQVEDGHRDEGCRGDSGRSSEGGDHTERWNSEEVSLPLRVGVHESGKEV